MKRLCAALLLILVGCQPPLAVSPAVLPPLHGRLGDAWQVQAAYGDFAPGGTASLVDPVSERTVAGGTTGTDGGFSVAFEPDFQPAAGAGYWLEVSRRIGSTWLSLRSVAVWDGIRWLSVSNGPSAPDAPVLINARTTAVALVLRDSGLPLLAALGRIDGGDLGQGRTAAMVRELEERVRTALLADEDPVALGAGAVLAIDPPTAGPGERVTIRGYGFGGAGRVTVAGEPLTVTSWQPGTIEAVLPALATGGALSVEPVGGEAIRHHRALALRRSWRSLPSLPQSVGGDAPAAGALGGQLVVAGGKGATGKALANVWAFDAAEGRWRARTPLPTPRYGMASAVVGGRLYAIGGWDDAKGYSGAVEIYDPTTDSWSRGVPLPGRRLGAAAAVLEGKLYVFGGYDGQETATTYVYTPGSDGWATAAPMPAARFRHGATAHQDRILVAGGRREGAPLADAALYDAAADLWIPTTAMPAARAAGVLVGDGQRSWYLFGSDGRPRTDGWMLTAGGWQAVPAAAAARAGSAAAWVNGEVHVVGGASGDAASGLRADVFTP